MGSFINVAALRYPAVPGQSGRLFGALLRPGSRCRNCLIPLRPYHNIPIISYAFLAGRCGYCHSAISIRYPVVEIATALLCLTNGIVFGPGWQLTASLIFSYALVALSLIDLDHQLLPDLIVFPLLWSGLLINCTALFADLQSAVLGAVAGYLAPWVICHVHHYLTGKQGMGHGDFKLLAAIGAWLGWQMLPAVILISSVGGLLASATCMVIHKHSANTPLPFGPWLALAAWIMMIGSDDALKNHLWVPHP